MAMFTLHVNGSEVKLATNKLQFGTPSFVDLSPLKIKCERATTAEASKNAAAFDYEDMTQTQIDGAYVTPTYLAIKETEGSNRGIIAYSFTMKLTHRDGASSHDDQWYRFKLGTDSDSGIVKQCIQQIFVQKNRATANGNTGPFIVDHDYANYSYGYICCDNGNDESDSFYVDVFVVAYYTNS